MVANICDHLSPKYADLSYITSEHKVLTSRHHLLTYWYYIWKFDIPGQIVMSTFPENYIYRSENYVDLVDIKWQVHEVRGIRTLSNTLKSQHKDLTSRHNFLTSGGRLEIIWLIWNRIIFTNSEEVIQFYVSYINLTVLTFVVVLIANHIPAQHSSRSLQTLC